MRAYKLVKQRKDGSLGPLFINASQRLIPGEWMKAEAHTRKGFAFRPGWHCCLTPEAPHLSEKGRVWVEVEVADYTLYDRPASQGGQWVLAEHMRIVEVMR